MRNKVLLTILIFTQTVFVFSQTDEKKILQELNQSLLTNFQAGKLDDALKSAEKTFEITNKIFGAESNETAAAHTNLGIIYKEKRKFGKSAQHLQLALAIYLKTNALTPQALAQMYETLATVQFFDGKLKESEQNYLKALETTQAKFGNDSKQAFPLALSLASLYSKTEKYDEADRFYLLSSKIALKNFGVKSNELIKVSDTRLCLTDEFETNREALFYKEYARLFPSPSSSDSVPENTVINGKAEKLVVPPYPLEARKERAAGIVKVRVRIDRSGNVIKADAVCGVDVLRKNSEAAARASKFTPTYLNGSPAEVTGIIIYNFSQLYQQRIVAMPISRPF